MNKLFLVLVVWCVLLGCSNPTVAIFEADSPWECRSFHPPDGSIYFVPVCLEDETSTQNYYIGGYSRTEEGTWFAIQFLPYGESGCIAPDVSPMDSHLDSIINPECSERCFYADATCCYGQNESGEQVESIIFDGWYQPCSDASVYFPNPETMR